MNNLPVFKDENMGYFKFGNSLNQIIVSNPKDLIKEIRDDKNKNDNPVLHIHLSWHNLVNYEDGFYSFEFSEIPEDYKIISFNRFIDHTPLNLSFVEKMPEHLLYLYLPRTKIENETLYNLPRNLIALRVSLIGDVDCAGLSQNLQHLKLCNCIQYEISGNPAKGQKLLGKFDSVNRIKNLPKNLKTLYLECVALNNLECGDIPESVESVIIAYLDCELKEDVFPKSLTRLFICTKQENIKESLLLKLKENISNCEIIFKNYNFEEIGFYENTYS
jgi:hypothetical protein